MNSGKQENYSPSSHAWYPREFHIKPYNDHAFKISKSSGDEIMEIGRIHGNFPC